MSLPHKKLLTFLAVLACVAAAGYHGIDYLKDVRDKAVYATQIARIKEISGIKKIDDFHKHVDSLRVFINKNSQHKTDEEFYAAWRDKTKIAGNFIDYLEKRRKILPHMECATRTSLMAAVLDSEGYRIRAVDAFNPLEGKTLMSHTLLDVYNPNTKTWETQDPEYNVYWKNRKTGKRATMAEAGLDPYIQPCNAKGCGWGLKGREKNDTANLKPYTAFVTTIDRNAQERITFYRKGIDPNSEYDYGDKHGTFCKVLKKNCRDGFLESTTENLKRAKD